MYIYTQNNVSFIAFDRDEVLGLPSLMSSPVTLITSAKVVTFEFSSHCTILYGQLRNKIKYFHVQLVASKCEAITY